MEADVVGVLDPAGRGVVLVGGGAVGVADQGVLSLLLEEGEAFLHLLLLRLLPLL